MGIQIWCLIASIFLISVKAELHDHVSQSFYETPQSSSPSPLPLQSPPPELTGKKEIILFLTPDQVDTLQAAGAVVRPYPEYEFTQLQEQFQQSNEEQNEQQQPTEPPNEGQKQDSGLENYYKLLNIQEINENLAQLTMATEGTTEKLTTTPRYKYTKSRQQYKDKEYLTPYVPKKANRIKISNQNTNSEYVRFLPNYESENLKMVPYQAIPVSPFRYGKINVYSQANEQAQRNAYTQAIENGQRNAHTQANEKAKQNVYTQANDGAQRNTYPQANYEAQRNEYTQATEVAQGNGHTQANEEVQRNAYTQMNEKAQQNRYTQANDMAQRNAYIQANDEAERNAYTEANDDAQRNAYTQANDEAQRNAYTQANEKAQPNVYTQVNIQAQRNAYSQANKKAQQNAYTQVNDEAQRNAYTPANIKAQRNKYTQANDEGQRNAYTQMNEKAQQNRYTQANDKAQRNAYTQANEKAQRNGHTQANDEAQQNASTQANDEAQRNAYTPANIKAQRNRYTQANDEGQRNAYTLAIKEVQRNAYTQANEEAQRSVYIQATEATQGNQANEEAQRNAYTEANEEAQRNVLKSPMQARVPVEEEFEKPQAIVEVPTSKLTQLPVTIQKRLRAQDTAAFKETLASIEGLPSLEQQQEKPETPVPTVQTLTDHQDKLSLLLAPLYQHQTITETIAQQREELLSGEFHIQSKLHQIKQAPKHYHHEYTTEVENLTRNLGKQNALAKIEAISKSPSVFINQESETTSSPIEFVKQNEFPQQLEVRIPAPYPVPLEIIRRIPFPVPKTEKPTLDEVETRVSIPGIRNVYVKVDKPYVAQKVVPLSAKGKIPVNIPIYAPEQLSIIRHIWEH